MLTQICQIRKVERQTACKIKTEDEVKHGSHASEVISCYLSIEVKASKDTGLVKLMTQALWKMIRPIT